MNPPQFPLPPTLRCLAVLPAFIMMGTYVFLDPAPPSKTPPARAALAEVLPPIGEQIEGADESPASPERDAGF